MKTIRLTESMLNRLVKKAIMEHKRKRLTESTEDIKREVEEMVKQISGDDIEWISENSFQDNHGCNGYIFNDIDEAEESCYKGGKNHQIVVDFLDEIYDGRLGWLKHFIDDLKYDEDEAYEICKSWDSIIEEIIAVDGVEVVLPLGYSNECYDLSNGMIFCY